MKERDDAGNAEFRITGIIASWLVQAGRDLYEVAKLLGYSSVIATQRYAHLKPDEFTAAEAALDSFAPGAAREAQRGVVNLADHRRRRAL